MAEKIICNNAQFISYAPITGIIETKYPKIIMPVIADFYSKMKLLKNGFYHTELSPPRKPRTTGKKSQNTHVHGHAAQIAEYQGDSKNNVIEYAKCLAVERQELRPMIKNGKEVKNVFEMVRGISETEMSTAECASVIERLHDIAGFLGIVLREE